MELIIPPNVSIVLGGGFPSRGCSVMDFVTIAPKAEISVRSLISVPYPKVPDATNTGFLKTVWPIFIVRLVKIYFPGLKYGTIRAHQGVFHMIGMLGLLIISPFDGTTLT